MNKRFATLMLILLVAKTIKLEDVAEKSESIAIMITVGFIILPIYLVFKIIQEIKGYTKK